MQKVERHVRLADRVVELGKPHFDEKFLSRVRNVIVTNELSSKNKLVRHFKEIVETLRENLKPDKERLAELELSQHPSDFREAWILCETIYGETTSRLERWQKLLNLVEKEEGLA